MGNDVSSFDQLIASTTAEIGELQDWLSRSQGEPLTVYVAVSLRLAERQELLQTVVSLRSVCASE